MIKQKDVKENNIKAKNVKIRSTTSASGRTKKAQGYIQKRKQNISRITNQVYTAEKKYLPEEEEMLKEEVEETGGKSPFKNSSQMNEWKSQKKHGGQSHQS